MLKNPVGLAGLMSKNIEHNDKMENPYDDDSDASSVASADSQSKNAKSESKSKSKSILDGLAKGKKPEKSEDEEEGVSTEVLELRRKLTAYITSARFAPFLKKIGYNGPYLKKMQGFDKEKLEKELFKIKFVVRNRNSQKFYEELVFMLVQVIETSSKGKLNGLTSLCRADEGFLDSIEELRIENSQVFMIQNSKIHAAIVFLTKVLQAYAVNKIVSNLPAQAVQTAVQAAQTQPNVKAEPPKTKPKKETTKTNALKAQPGIISQTAVQTQLDTMELDNINYSILM